MQEVVKVIASAGVPRRITQQPFDGDPSHYWRLCNLGNGQPAPLDLLDYALDLQYMEVQPDLLRYLTPTLLAAWRRDLFEGDEAGYVGFAEQLWPALLKGKALGEVYSELERQAFNTYMRNAILDRLDGEDSLRFSGNRGTAYRWVGAFVSYGTLFPDIQNLWNEWWQMKTQGHAISAFQHISALMYEDDKNPVFDAWTPEKGGGPPAVWNCAGMLSDVGWKTENLDFIKTTLSVDYFETKLHLAYEQIQKTDAKKVAGRIRGDFAGQLTRLELRIEQLPDLLKDVSRLDGFQI